MKFALLFAAVSAITLRKDGPDSKNDPLNPYSQIANSGVKAIQDTSNADVDRRNADLKAQENADAWRKEFNPKA